jgi:hypothetical protein
MTFEKEQLDRIFQRTGGMCHLCHKPLCRKNYAIYGTRGAWEVEHSVPQCNGGSHHGNNLYAACISCNRSKGKVTTRTARRWNGKTRAPMSLKRRKQAQTENTVILATVGGILGCAFGPAGAVAGAAIGGKIGSSLDPNQTG